MYKMLSSQDSVGSNDQPIMQVTMVPNPMANAGNQQPNLSTQATVMPAVTMATVQIPQMRVLQAIATRTEQMQHFQHPVQTMPQLTQVHQQPQQIQIIKSASSSKGDIFVPTSLQTLVGVKTPISSPGKAATAVVALQNPRMVTHANLPAKLKVGDTIVIPAKTLNTMNPSSSVGTQSIVIKNEQGTPGQLVFSTPTKLVPAVGKSPMLGSPSTPQQSQIRYASNQQPSTPVSSTLTSPMRLTTISPSSWTPSPMRYKRSNDYGDQDSFSDNVKKSRRTPIGQDKGSKGLRHFAMLVCEKVKQKITTTYNEVADELVKEYATTQRHFSDQQYDQKNIRRRVYDALNVLMAMNIIYKDKKDIHWVGLPTNSAQELQSLQSEKQRREQRIKQKTAQLHELILQQIAFKNLVQRNKRLQQAQGPPASNSAIQLPFIIVNTSKKTVIDCSISNDKYEYLFNFDNTFEIHDDIEVLKRMGMAYGLEKGTCSKEDLKVAQSLVPPVLRPYLEEMAGYSKDMDALTSSTSASSSQTMDSSNGGQSSIGVQSSQIGSSPYDGHQLLSSIKHDPDDQEVALMIQEDSQGSSSSLTMTGPSSSSRSSSVDALSSIIQQGGAVPSPSFDISCLPTSSMSPGNFDT